MMVNHSYLSMNMHAENLDAAIIPALENRKSASIRKNETPVAAGIPSGAELHCAIRRILSISQDFRSLQKVIY